MKNISNFQKYIFKSILIFFVFLFSISKTLFANEIFILKNEGLSTLPPSYLEFLEGYDENNYAITLRTCIPNTNRSDRSCDSRQQNHDPHSGMD